MINVLIIGPSIERTKGGMATVISDQLKQSGKQVCYQHIVSHVEGSAGEKLWYTMRSFGSFLRRKHIDIVHIHVASGASFYRKSLFVWAARALGRPVVLHVHGADFDSFYQQASPSMQKLFRRTFSACVAVLVLSSYWKDFFTRHFPGTRIEVLHNGVYTETFRSCMTAPAHQRSFLFLGRLGERKGVYDLLKAVEELVNEGKRDLLFYLAGDGEVEEVKRLVSAKDLKGQVKVVGWTSGDKKLELLQKVDTMVLPSYNEGLPMAILEAMAAGKAIISTRVGGIPDLVEEGINGFLIEPGDVPSLKQRLQFLSEHPEEVVRIAQQNMYKIEKEYNLETIYQELEQLYAQIKNNHQAKH